jgi:DNA-directed RNA polymerase specialized sigma24 family protein
MYVTEANPCNRSALMKKFESLSSSFDECDFTGRHAWIDTIDDPRLIVVLKKLTEKELDVLTYLILEEHSQAELAQKWGCSQKAISKQLHKIKKYFQ